MGERQLSGHQQCELQFIFSRVEYKERIILLLVCSISHRLPCGTSFFTDTSLCVVDYYAALISDQLNFNTASTACFRPSSKILKCWKYEAPIGITEHEHVLPFLETDL